jgi:hypothetical protein
LFYRDEETFFSYFFLAAVVVFDSWSDGDSLTNGIFSAYSRRKILIKKNENS